MTIAGTNLLIFLEPINYRSQTSIVTLQIFDYRQPCISLSQSSNLSFESQSVVPDKSRTCERKDELERFQSVRQVYSDKVIIFLNSYSTRIFPH